MKLRNTCYNDPIKLLIISKDYTPFHLINMSNFKNGRAKLHFKTIIDIKYKNHSSYINPNDF